MISFHVPLTSETERMADNSFFSGLKKKPIIINSSRGKIIDLEALATGLEKGLVSGACLDVLPNEKLASYSDKEKQLLDHLLSMPQVLNDKLVGDKVRNITSAENKLFYTQYYTLLTQAVNMTNSMIKPKRAR